MEKYYIWKYNTFKDKYHYNLTPGGDFVPSKVPEIAKKISKANSGKNNYMYGKKHTDIAKQKMSNKRKEYYKTHKPWNKGKKCLNISKKISGKNNPMYGKTGKDNPMYGKKHTLKTKQKISEANSGKNNGRYGKHLTQEEKDYLSKVNSRPKTLQEQINMSKAKNISGYFRVHKNENSSLKQGYRWVYSYYDNNGKRHSITSVNIDKLEQKVKKEGLLWIKF